jgi:phosphoglycolate phosphatase-like HAD superfamily hydrolase
MPGARELVEALAGRGVPIGLATGNTAEGARIKLERADLWRHFGCGGFGSDARERAQLVRVAIDRACHCFGQAFTPDEVLIIGDTPLDVAAGHAVGVRVATVATGGYTVEQLIAAGADEAWPTLVELAPRLVD